MVIENFPVLALAAFSGIVGLAFYEGVRIYRCTTSDQHPVPNNRLGWHLFGLSLLAIAASSLAVALAQREFIEGIILGFSVPSGLKAVTGRQPSEAQIDDNWDDVKPLHGSRFVAKLEDWFRSYF